MSQDAPKKHAPVKRIKGYELLPLLREKKVKLVTEITKSKKKAGVTADLYSQEFRWVDTNEPLLTPDGMVDCRATPTWGIPPPERRNTGQFGKPDGEFDVCELQFGTKTGGELGELMCELNDHTYPASINEFTQRSDQKETYNGHEIIPYEFCKKFTGSATKPVSDLEQKAYQDAANWAFTVKIKIQKYITDQKTNLRKPVNHLFMCKVVKYILGPDGRPVEQEIKINSANIHKELTKGSSLLIAMRPGNGTMKAERNAKSKITCNTFHSAWNFNHITVLKKGEFSTSKIERSDEEIRAMLQEAGGTLAFPNDENSETYCQQDEHPDDSHNEPEDDLTKVDNPTQSSAQFKPTSTGVSAVSLAAQFAQLNS